MTRIPIAALLVIGLCSLHTMVPSHARAGNEAKERTQWAHFSTLVAKVRQLRKKVQQAREITQRVMRNSKRMKELFTSRLFEAVETEIDNIARAGQQTKILGLHTENVEAALAKQYPGYAQYREMSGTGEFWRKKHATWHRQFQQSTTSALAQMEHMIGALAGTGRFREGLRDLVGKADGRQQMLEVLNAISNQQNRELKTLEELMIVNVQSQTNFFMTEQSRRAAIRALYNRHMQKNKDIAPFVKIGDELSWGDEK